MIVTRDHLEAALAELRANVTDPAAGILGPRSVAWQLGADLALFLGGGRAALLQLAHPMVAHAVEQHSRTREDVAGRFQRTFRNVFAMVFGDLDAAFAAARRVHAIHARVHGVLPARAGRWEAGTPYHANDLESLRWVHVTLIDTTIAVRELIDGPLPRATKDAYLTEMRRFGALFGIPAAMLATTWPEHERYVAEMIASRALAVTPVARELASFLLGTSGEQPPLGRLGELVSHAMLPAPIAAELGLRGAPRRTRLGLAAFAQLYRRLPPALIAIPAATEARRRLAGQGPSRWSVWKERQLFGLARRTTARQRPR